MGDWKAVAAGAQEIDIRQMGDLIRARRRDARARNNPPTLEGE